MKHDTISLRRRHLIIAGLAGIAAPAGVFAAQWGGTQHTAPAAVELMAAGGTGEGQLVVSGRILGPDGKPLAGAAVEAWQGGDSKLRASAMTDADGRFMFTTGACAQDNGRPQSISYRVTHQRRGTVEKRIDYARTPDLARGPDAQLQRDETGTWRAAVGLAFA